VIKEQSLPAPERAMKMWQYPKYGLITTAMTTIMAMAMTDDDNNNKGVNLMFNSTLTTKGASKWVRTIPLRTQGE
jgi:hypothetical protein